MQRVKVAVVGVGTMGQIHCETLLNLKDVELVAVCDEDGVRAKEVGERFNSTVFSDHRQLLESGCCEAVVIATPHYSHIQIGIDALAAGMHVLVEKPLGVHKADCERLIKAHTDKNKVFAVMFNQRTNPCYRKVKQLVASGELGELMRVNWIITDWFRPQCYYNSGGWRATWAGEGGGVLINQCPHQLDLLQWFCGMPVRVSAHCQMGKYHKIEVEDDVTALLEYSNGATGVFITSTGEAPGTNRLELTGTRGRIVVENDRLTFIRNEEPCDEFSRTTKNAFAKPSVWNIEIPVEGVGGQHREVFENFLQAILKKEPLIAPGDEGLHSVELANAMLLSSIEGHPVDLPQDGQVYKQLLEKLCQESCFEKQVEPADLSGVTTSF